MTASLHNLSKSLLIGIQSFDTKNSEFLTKLLNHLQLISIVWEDIAVAIFRVSNPNLEYGNYSVYRNLGRLFNNSTWSILDNRSYTLNCSFGRLSIARPKYLFKHMAMRYVKLVTNCMTFLSVCLLFPLSTCVNKILSVGHHYNLRIYFRHAHWSCCSPLISTCRHEHGLSWRPTWTRPSPYNLNYARTQSACLNVITFRVAGCYNAQFIFFRV
jgi:hypothetical protein